VSHPIEVFRRGDGSTRISVRDYPDARAKLRVRSSGDDGRRLEVLGWSNFKRTRELGHLDLHVDGKKPLLIARFAFEDHTLASEADEVLGRLLVCVESIAMELLEKLGIDHGYVDWQAPEPKMDAITRLYARYRPTTARDDLERGTRCLRWCPTS
jgi:hypothetical protein